MDSAIQNIPAGELNAEKVVSSLTALMPGSQPEKLEKVKLLMQQCVTLLTSKIAEESKKQLTSVSKESESLYTAEAMSVLEPRGKFKTSFGRNGICLQGNNSGCFVPWESITHALFVPSHFSTKKDGENLLALHLCDDGVKYTTSTNSKNIYNVLLPLQKGNSNLSITFEGITHEGNESVIIGKLFEKLQQESCTRCSSLIFDRPQKDIFLTAQGTPFLKCFKGIQEGSLFPLGSGMLFIKPMLFLPSDCISSMTAGRGGSAQTRYIDLKVETIAGKEFEFGSIDRDALPPIQGYVQSYVAAREKAERRRVALELREAQERLASSSGEVQSPSTNITVAVPLDLAEEDSEDDSDEDFDASDDDNYSDNDSDDSGDESGNCSDASVDSDGDDKGSSKKKAKTNNSTPEDEQELVDLSE